MEAVERAARTIQSNVNTHLKALRQNLQETGSSARKIIFCTLEYLYHNNLEAQTHMVNPDTFWRFSGV